MQRVVYLPQGRCVTLGNYVHAWRLALTAPDTAVFKNAFTWYPQTNKRFFASFDLDFTTALIAASMASLAHSDLGHIPALVNTTINGKLRLTAPQFNSTSHVSSSTGYPPG